MASLEIIQFPYNTDNYGVLLHSSATGETACIDAGDAAATELALSAAGWSLTHVLITHHHGDHTAGLDALKKTHGCYVIGPKDSNQAISGLDQQVGEKDTFTFAGSEVQVIHTPGHTTDMINYYLPAENLVFTGDTLFVLGCGRLFEGNASMMWQSLQKLMSLPENTLVYCSHEYTMANAAFAITIDPENIELRACIDEYKMMRADNRSTVPTTIAKELASNPFLRAGNIEIRKHLGMPDAKDSAVFAEIRSRKDKF